MNSEPEFDPEKAIGVIGIAVGVTIIFIRWIIELLRKVPADPWPLEIDQAVRKRDAVPVCVDCLCPQESHGGFCRHCGFPTGEYVTSMPYLQIFAVGEFLRRGVTGPPDKSLFRQLGWAVSSMTQYSIFFPVYWFWLVSRACGRSIGQPHRVDLRFEDEEIAESNEDPSSAPH
jgi:hypothetical protein